ncbi:LVIVD repeat-containing protein [Emticicia sp. 17c]|uniref:LVIVD repeat-containing protein n=1 Tax=Emticicia sp. 17c TaxID=3127704 RepID=UPI00301DD4CE
MKNNYFRLLSVALGLCIAVSNISCTDECVTTRTYRTTQPVVLMVEDIRKGIAAEGPQELVKPGKIYVKDNYLFINEIKKGIHIIDNTNPEKPLNMAFLKIPGVIDVAVKENTLYADSYMDMVTFDITDPKSIKETGRVKNVFTNGLVEGINWFYNAQSQTVTDYEFKIVTDKVRSNCGFEVVNPNPIYYYQDLNYAGADRSSGASGGTGKGGSMARFTIYDNYLYTVSQNDLLLFNIKTLSEPVQEGKINLGWGIETIFPYKDKLFIGSNTGMYIFDNKNPAKPERVTMFEHARACDPVVVHNDIAYVTLRSGWCGVAPNRLDVVDVGNIAAPRLIKSYEMKNPAGLGIDFPNLFICEGGYGLKSFDASSVSDIKLQQHIENINAFDVIPMGGNHLLMIGQGGLYQYNTTDPKNMKLLSVIPVKKQP